MKNFFCAALLFLFPAIIFASHIVGGEMYYRYLGNSQYEISLVVYRDCFNGQASYDPEAAIGIFDSNGNFIDTVMVPYNGAAYVPNAINTPCLTPPQDVCVEVSRYYTTITLPALPGGYTIVYQRCCRNYSCINIMQYSGATYITVIPDQQFAVDDSPVFKNLPPTFICAGAPFTFDHSATDADGDSLVYSLYAPLDGGDTSQLGATPNPPMPPPYNAVTFVSPYSTSNFLGGIPMVIDPNTGMLTATPSDEGQYVYGIVVQEYRNGVLIGETRRDFQVNVTFCPDYTVASIFSPTIVCGTLDAQFINMSYGATGYSWSFGDPSTTNDTSSLQNPAYTYPDTGIYSLMLIAFAADSACNDTSYGQARVYPDFFSRLSLMMEPCNNNIQLFDSSYSQHSGANYWLWNFGDGQFSGTQNPVHQYINPGNYTITFIASADSGCTDTATVNVGIDPVPVSLFSLNLDTCAHTGTFSNFSQQADSYNWSFGDNTFSTMQSPQHNYMTDGNVTVYLVASNDSGCTDTSQFTFNLPKVPIADFNWSIAPCDSLVHFQNLSLNSPNSIWSFGDNSVAFNTNPVHLYVHSGAFNVTMQALGTNLTCTDQLSRTVYVNRKPNAEFLLALDTCLLQISADNYSADATKYHWIFSDGFTDQSANPEHVFASDGNISVQLIAENDSGCSDTASNAAFFPPLPESDFVWSYVECDSLVTFAEQSTNAVAYRWLFGDGESLDDAQAEHIYHIAGDIPVKLVSTSQYGCRDTAGKDIHIVIRTAPDFEAFLDSCAGTVYFTNKSPVAVYYDWNFGDQTASTEENPAHVYNQNAQNYIVTFTVNKATDCQEFIQKPLRYEVNEGEIVYIPNSFTPNGDGLNDVFSLSLWKPCDIYSITVFDRWGHAVYSNEDAYTTYWDGTFSGHSVPPDVYVYVLEGSHLKKTGYVLLIR